MPKSSNLPILMVGQFSRDSMGCCGSPVVGTPNLDRLAVSEGGPTGVRREIWWRGCGSGTRIVLQLTCWGGCEV